MGVSCIFSVSFKVTLLYLSLVIIENMGMGINWRVVLPLLMVMVGCLMLANMWKTNKINKNLEQEIQRKEEETKTAFQHKGTCETEVKEVNNNIEKERRDSENLKNEVDKLTEDSMKLEQENEQIDNNLESDDVQEDELMSKNSELTLKLKNSNNEVEYLQCKLDILKKEENALKGGDIKYSANLEEKCVLKVEEPEDELDYAGSGDEGSGDYAYDEDEYDDEEEEGDYDDGLDDEEYDEDEEDYDDEDVEEDYENEENVDKGYDERDGKP